MQTISRVLLVAVISLAACKKGDDKGATTSADKPVAGGTATAPGGDKPAGDKPAAPAGRAIANSNNLEVDAPAAWEDNGVGGAAGMHKGDSDWMISDLSPEEAAKKLAAVKTDDEAMLFQKWISAEEKDGVIKVIYAMDKMKTVGDEMKKDGTVYAFDVRRTIDGKAYSCHGGAVDEATAKEAAGICSRIHTAQ